MLPCQSLATSARLSCWDQILACIPSGQGIYPTPQALAIRACNSSAGRVRLENRVEREWGLLRDFLSCYQVQWRCYQSVDLRGSRARNTWLSSSFLLSSFNIEKMKHADTFDNKIQPCFFVWLAIPCKCVTNEEKHLMKIRLWQHTSSALKLSNATSSQVCKIWVSGCTHRGCIKPVLSLPECCAGGISRGQGAAGYGLQAGRKQEGYHHAECIPAGRLVWEVR